MPRHRAVALVLICTALNIAGFTFGLFEPVPLYDGFVHFLTPFTLVAITSEIIYRAGGDDVFFASRSRALLTGAAIGVLGAIGWEIVEVTIDSFFPAISIYNPLPDTLLDVALGTVGGGLGAWRADRYLDRLTGSRS